MVIAYVRTWCDNEPCHTSVMLAGIHDKAIESLSAAKEEIWP